MNTPVLPKNDITSGVIVIAYAVVIVFFVYNHNWVFKTTNETLKWRQPEFNIKTDFISPSNFELNFHSIEKSLRNITFDSQGNLVLNSITANVVHSIVDNIHEKASQQTLNRVVFLVSKSFPQYNSTELTDLILNYRLYRLDYKKIKSNQSHSPNIKEAELRLIENIKLKKMFMGEKRVNKLFSRTHEMAFYILNRRKLLSNQDLSNTQKETLLKQLSEQLI